MGLLSEEIPSYEALIHEEELPPLNLKLILDSVSSVPLYERLDIDKESLSENETKVMELIAEKYSDKISHLICDKKPGTYEDDFNVTYEDDFNVLETEFSQIEDFSDIFLKNLYNCSDNDELLIRLKKNIPFDEGIQESTSEVKLVNEIEPYTPSKEFLHFFLNASDGKHDNLVVHEVLPSDDVSSDVSSDESNDIRDAKIKKLTLKLRFCDSSNSKFLEPIINASKPSVFEIMPESSLKISSLKKEEIFLSDSESENDLKKKCLVFEVNKTSNKKLPYQIEKDLKVSKKKREKFQFREGKKNIKKVCESKSGEKKAIENIQRPEGHSDVPFVDQDKISLDNTTTSAASTTVLVSTRGLSSIDENVKGINRKQVNNEASSSDEDWEGLAEKNLFLRSKTLGQKVAKKK